MRLQRACIEMAGVAGFEPAHGDTKNRCLTTWPHPNIPAFYNLSRRLGLVQLWACWRGYNT